MHGPALLFLVCSCVGVAAVAFAARACADIWALSAAGTRPQCSPISSNRNKRYNSYWVRVVFCRIVEATTRWIMLHVPFRPLLNMLFVVGRESTDIPAPGHSQSYTSFATTSPARQIITQIGAPVALATHPKAHGHVTTAEPLTFQATPSSHHIVSPWVCVFCDCEAAASEADLLSLHVRFCPAGFKTQLPSTPNIPPQPVRATWPACHGGHGLPPTWPAQPIWSASGAADRVLQHRNERVVGGQPAAA